MSLPVCGRAYCLPDQVLPDHMSQGCLVCNHLSVAVFCDVYLCCLLLCHFLTASVARQECAVDCFLVCGVRKPNYQGSLFLLAIAVELHVCLEVVLVSSCPQARLAVMAGNGYGYGADSEEGGKKSRRAHKGHLMCCVLPPWYPFSNQHPQSVSSPLLTAV